MRSLISVLLLVAACDCAGDEAEPEAPAAEPADLLAYFPSAPGDRWRYEAAGEKATRAISFADDVDAVPRRVVMTGGDLMGARYHEVSDEGVFLVTPSGEAIGTLLDAPVQEGHEWSYVFGDVGCEARYVSVSRSIEVAGLAYEACLEVERTCTHPAGTPFPVETAEIHTETYCPGVGRVREHTRIEPPPPGSDSAERTDELVFYRVLNSPAPVVPEAFGCDHFLLVDTDVRAACGRELPRLTEVDLEEGCRMTFGAQNAPAITVTGQRFAEDATQADLDELQAANAALVGADDAVSHGYLQERHAIAVAGPPGLCDAEKLDRLGPLLQSLVRR
ncbi:MAG: hypothetical protein JJ863_08915 [Deltaproteobacteria bacterium]|nr:hypothetical protein [Deltaproteobacteria bacterium]